MWHFHKWTKWVEKETGDVVRSYDQKVIGTYIFFVRECTECGIKQYKKIRIDVT